MATCQLLVPNLEIPHFVKVYSDVSYASLYSKLHIDKLLATNCI